MAVNIPVELACQFESIMHILDAHIACPLIMWNTAYEVTAQFHGFAHQLTSIGEGHDTILGEGDQLQVTNITYLLTHFNQCPECGQVRIAYIDMAANVKSSLSNLPADLFHCP